MTASSDSIVDLRSDTLTKPTDAMRAAMATAEVGDDVFGEDPTVNELEARVADLLRTEAAVFVTSGTQSNLCALLAHCGRGDEYLVGQRAHAYRWEAGGAAVLGSIQPQPIEMAADGTMDLDSIADAIKKQPSGYHFALSKLLCLEDTNDGHPLPRDYVSDAQQLARDRGLSLHLDGARLWNSAVAQGLAPHEVAAGFDTISVCLSKGLGTPMGSVLAGRRDLVDEARRWRKMVGGGLRQVGIVAAAGLHAIDHHIDRLADDHRRAARLADGLAAMPGLSVDGAHTNMLFVHVDAAVHDAEALGAELTRLGIGLFPGPTMRLVCHLDIDDADIDRTLEAFAAATGASES